MMKFDIKNPLHTGIPLTVIIAAAWFVYKEAPAAVDNFKEYHVDTVNAVMKEPLERINLWAQRTDEEVAEQRIYGQVTSTESDLRWARREIYELAAIKREADRNEEEVPEYVLNRIEELEAEIRELETRRDCLENENCQ